jgi:cytochrome P450 family 110
MALPPGPRFALPYLFEYLRDPLASSRKSFQRWGDPHMFAAFGTRLFVTADPTLIRAILDVNPEHLDAFGVKRMAPVIGQHSILMIDGERHRAARKLQTPPFHGSRMRAYAETMREVARAEAASWNRPFAMQESTQAISLRVILQAVLGAVGEKAAQLERLLVELIGALRPELLMMGAVQHAWYPPWARFVKRRVAVENWVLAEIQARRAAPEPRQDILSLLLSS